MLALTLAYDGSDFAGSQVQPGQRSVQGELGAALGRVGQPDLRTTFAGRTDRGVHAAGQVVSIADRWPELEPDRIRRVISSQLPEDLGVSRVERRAVGFHARFDATWRLYRYIIGQDGHQPVGRRFVWFRSGALLDIAAMQSASARFAGTRDCAALAGGGQGVPWSETRDKPRGTIRTILGVVVEPADRWWSPVPDVPGIAIWVAADGFLPRMVRNIVAMLVEVGRGTREPGWIDQVLDGGDRRHGTGTAPAHGLTLWRVGYGDDRIGPDPPWTTHTTALPRVTGQTS
jgi:tRNA pseudouridine38-40 synthase